MTQLNPNDSEVCLLGYEREKMEGKLVSFPAGICVTAVFTVEVVTMRSHYPLLIWRVVTASAAVYVRIILTSSLMT